VEKKKVIFICTGNSCRSQIAEGLLRNLAGDKYEVYSAGLLASGVNPYAIEVMKEVGIDITDQHSDRIGKYKSDSFDIVVTVCDHAKEYCPTFPGSKAIHWSIKDPYGVEGPYEVKLQSFRECRDLLKQKIDNEFMG